MTILLILFFLSNVAHCAEQKKDSQNILNNKQNIVPKQCINPGIGTFDHKDSL